jgi:predicted DNA-binding WGR domain protein
MLMNFGPINQRGGEKRLNVIFSRARHHMAVVSSIRHHAITNDFNDGANSLKNFLQYAEAISKGDGSGARRVLENLNPLARKALAPVSQDDAVVHGIARALRERGYAVDLNVGQSRFRCDLAVRGNSDNLYQLGILVDTDGHYAGANLLDRYLMQPAILRAFGWRYALVLTKDWYHSHAEVLTRLERLLHGQPDDACAEAGTEAREDEPAEATAPAAPFLPPDPSRGSSPGPGVPPASATADGKPGQVPSSPGAAAGSTAGAGPAASNPATFTRCFEFLGGGSRKFWEISQVGNSCTVRFGRIGTPGQTQTKTFANEARARREADSLIAEKLKKGYLEKARAAG